jgi:hypothetical protein
MSREILKKINNLEAVIEGITRLMNTLRILYRLSL